MSEATKERITKECSTKERIYRRVNVPKERISCMMNKGDQKVKFSLWRCEVVY